MGATRRIPRREASHPPDPTTRAWEAAVPAVAAALGSDVTAGLSPSEASRRLLDGGPNELTEGARTPALLILVAQFANTMTGVLAVAALVTAVVGDVAETIAITAIVVLNGVVGFVQELRADRTMAALRRLAASNAVAVRDGIPTTIPAGVLVPGDLVVLTAGDVVPADGRLVAVENLHVNEAPLTGESDAVPKTTDPVHLADGALVAERRNMVFKGTAVTSGRGQALLVATGMATELGRIAQLLATRADSSTPLERRLAVLGRRMAAAAVVVCGVVFAAGVASGEPVERMFVTAVSLAVAAIPEGLPAVVTVALALGARRMADRRALARRLPAVETLGSVTVICSDKTGTLTENRMVVERVWTPLAEHRVRGHGYEPTGSVTGERPAGNDPYLARAAHIAAACNDAALLAPDLAGGAWSAVGDPTEAALVALAARLGVQKDALDRSRPRVAEIGFDSSRRHMTTAHRMGDHAWVAVKGGVEAVLALLSDEDRSTGRRAAAVADRWASEGYRVLVLADRTVEDHDVADLERDLRLVAVVAMADPPRPEVIEAVRECRAAGITPVMITGDHALTATAVARRLGILTSGGAVLTGQELDALDDETLATRVADVQVYARTTPEQKLRIVDAWKRQGAIVAMTGDGVNDAPALRRADIGVAMGITGTDVSKEAADLVLADDNFATVVHAVEEGRRIYDNIRRFVRYLLTTNSGEIWVMFLAPLVGLPVPLTAVQILWVNLITDGLPAVALGLEPVERDAMRRPPRPPTESIFARGLWQHALWVGTLMGAVVIAVQATARAMGWHWPTMVFCTLAFAQLGHALAVRSERRSVRALGIMSNPWLLGAVLLTAAAQLTVVYLGPLQETFGTASLGAAELLVVAAASPIVFLAVEIEKRVRGRRIIDAGRSDPTRASSAMRAGRAPVSP